MKIHINQGSISIEAEFYETDLARAVAAILPYTGSGSLWGNEIYFSIPVSHDLQDPKEVVEKGDLAYWPPGNAFCIFWGPTPASSGSEARAASEVEVFGRVTGDLSSLSGLRSGSVEIVAE